MSQGIWAGSTLLQLTVNLDVNAKKKNTCQNTWQKKITVNTHAKTNQTLQSFLPNRLSPPTSSVKSRNPPCVMDHAGLVRLFL